MPAPIPLGACKYGLEVTSKGHFNSLFMSLHLNRITNPKCYDHHCPSLQATDKNGLKVIEKRTCPTCRLYHSTIKAMKAHKRFCLDQEIEEDDSVDLLFLDTQEDVEEEELEQEEQGLYEQDLLDHVEISGNIFHKINHCFGIDDI